MGYLRPIVSHVPVADIDEIIFHCGRSVPGPRRYSADIFIHFIATNLCPWRFVPHGLLARAEFGGINNSKRNETSGRIRNFPASSFRGSKFDIVGGGGMWGKIVRGEFV